MTGHAIPRRSIVLDALREQELTVPELSHLLGINRCEMAVLCHQYRQSGYVEIVGNHRPMKLRAVPNAAAKVQAR